MFQHTRVVRQRFKNKVKRAFCFLLDHRPLCLWAASLIPKAFCLSWEQSECDACECKRNTKWEIKSWIRWETVHGQTASTKCAALWPLRVSQRLIYFCFFLEVSLEMKKHAGVARVRWPSQGGGALTRKGRGVEQRALSASFLCPLTTLAPVALVFFLVGLCGCAKVFITFH